MKLLTLVVLAAVAALPAACTASTPTSTPTQAPYTVPPQADNRGAGRADYDGLVFAVNSDGRNFGGSYFTTRTGLVYHIGVVQDADPAVLAGVRRLIPTGGEVEFFPVTYSLNQLIEISDRLTTEANARFALVGIDEVNNRVTVAPLPGEEAAVRRIAAEFGPVVFVEPAMRMEGRPAD